MLNGTGDPLDNFKRKWFPFRRADDEIFQQSATKKETVYDNLGSMPERSYETELDIYVSSQWKRGLLQAVFPATLLGGVLGLFSGLNAIQYKNRHDPRFKVIAIHMGGAAMMCSAVTAAHQLMIMQNDYKDSLLFPLTAGVSGTTIGITMQGQSMAGGLLMGFSIGVTYTMYSWARAYYQNQRIKTFLQTQQHNETPIHKVAPEMQPLYRSFLYEFRPIENTPELRRAARLYSREENDFRVDSTSMLDGIQPEWYSWISFPDWWVLRAGMIAEDTESDHLLAARRNDEEFTRRYTGYLRDFDGINMKNIWRSSEHREEGPVGNFELHHERQARKEELERYGGKK